MKLWATLAAAGIIAGSSFAATSSTAKPQGDAMNRWSINVGLFIPEGDHKDAGVDNGFVVGADWMLPNTGSMGTASSYVGIMGLFGDGDNDLETRSWGIHYGVLFSLANNQGWSDFNVRLQGGYYNTQLEAGAFDEDEWGFGGMVSLNWRPRNSGVTVDAGYYFMPEVEGTDHRGWIFTVGIPVK
jgi:hypothetical protein